MYKLNSLSEKIWFENYKYGTEENVEDTWRRVAKAIANTPEEEELFYKALYGFNVIPGGRIIANAGVPGREKTTLINCFVHCVNDIGLKDPDSLSGIYHMLTCQAEILKTEGGYGTNFSWIRPAGSYVRGIDGRTPGVLKFMDMFDKSSEVVTAGFEGDILDKQIGEKERMRKGAQMGILSVWHPEIINFIKAKRTKGRFTKFNLSCGITSGFMEAVEHNRDWILEFPNINHSLYETHWDGILDNWKNTVSPLEVIEHNVMSAQELYNIIMLSTYNYNDPGVIFLDLCNKLNPLAYIEQIIACNPCGEITMSTDICDLGSVNLVKCIEKIGDKYYFNMEKFITLVGILVRLLDNVLDKTPLPLEKTYREQIKNKRRIGLGITGLGSALYILGLRYGSKEAIEFIKSVMKAKAESELLTSAYLGQEKGSFNLFNAKEYFNTYWWKNLKIDQNVKNTIEKIGCMRNSHHSMIAPTGNTSVFAELITGGCEPGYLLEFSRWKIVSDKRKADLRKQGFLFPNIVDNEFYETEHMKIDYRGEEQILKGSFNGQRFEYDRNRGLIEEEFVRDFGYDFVLNNFDQATIDDYKQRGVFCTTADLTVMEHIEMLEVMSHYTNQGISKTINIPNDYPFEDFKNIYMECWKRGIKGITTYRAGTMTAVLEETEKVESAMNELEKMFIENKDIVLDDVKLPKEFNSKGFKVIDSNGKKWYIIICFADSNYKHPFAVFVKTNCRESKEVTENLILAIENLCLNFGVRSALIEDQREKYNGQTNTDKMARAIGLALRHNIPIISIVEVLESFTEEISSFLYNLKKILEKYIPDGEVVMEQELRLNPNCETPSKCDIVYEQGCKMCKNCGFSVC